jgi:hypothetical protein
MARFVWDYMWRRCPVCRIVWKFDPPAWCFYCGGLTVPAEQPALPSDDLRHGTMTGYIAGCRFECCTEAHRMNLAAWRATRVSRSGSAH